MPERVFPRRELRPDVAAMQDLQRRMREVEYGAPAGNLGFDGDVTLEPGSTLDLSEGDVIGMPPPEVDDVPPPVGSTLTVSQSRGVVGVSWNGLDSTGGAMPEDFDHTVIESAPASDLTTLTHRGVLGKAGVLTIPGLEPGVAIRFRHYPVDSWGNRQPTASAWSDPVTPTETVDEQAIRDALEAVGAPESVAAWLGQFIRVQAGMIEANAVEADSIAAGAIQAHHLDIEDTDPVTGFKVTLDAHGIKLFDGDGQLVAAFSNDDINVLRVIDSTGNTLGGIDQDGVVTGQLGDFADLNVGGQPLTAPGGLLWDMPWGRIDGSYGQRNISGFRTQDREYGFLEIGAQVRADRDYVVTVLPFNVWNEPSQTTYFRLRYTYGDNVPTVSSSIIDAMGGRDAQTAETNLLTFGGSFLFQPAFTTQANILLTIGSETGIRVPGSPLGQVRVWVEDIGPRMVNGGRDRNSRLPVAGGTPPAEPTTTVRSRRTANWAPSDFRSYEGSGSTYSWPGRTSQYLFQGQSPVGAGILTSIATFGTNYTFLDGATITESYVTARVAHTYNNSGAVFQLMLHGNTTPPGTRPSRTFVTNKTAKAGTTLKIPIPSSFYAGIADGTYRGIGFGNMASGLGYYGYLDADSIRWVTKFMK